MMEVSKLGPIKLINTIEMLQENPRRQALKVRAWWCRGHKTSYYSQVGVAGSTPRCPKCNELLTRAGVTRLLLEPFHATPL